VAWQDDDLADVACLAEAYADLVTAIAGRRRDIREIRLRIGKYQDLAIRHYQRNMQAGYAAAEQAVLLMANQIARLTKEPWFEQAAIRALVVHECVLSLSGSESTDSKAAQRYWLRWWALQRKGMPEWLNDMASTTEAERSTGFEFWCTEWSDAEDKWRAAWEAFLASRGMTV
jgi:hypothetical protein